MLCSMYKSAQMEKLLSKNTLALYKKTTPQNRMLDNKLQMNTYLSLNIYQTSVFPFIDFHKPWKTLVIMIFVLHPFLICTLLLSIVFSPLLQHLRWIKTFFTNAAIVPGDTTIQSATVYAGPVSAGFFPFSFLNI